MKPFKIDVPQKTLDGIAARVRACDWHEMPRGEGLDDLVRSILSFARTLP